MEFIDFVGIAIAVALGVALAPYISRILLGLGGLLVAGVIIIVFLILWVEYPEFVEYFGMLVGFLLIGAFLWKPFISVVAFVIDILDSRSVAKHGVGHGPDEVWAENDEGKRYLVEKGTRRYSVWNGWYQKFSEDGTVVEEGNYDMGVKEGRWMEHGEEANYDLE